MENAIPIIEASATFIESAVILCTVVEAGGKKYSARKHILLALFLTVLITIYVSLMNAFTLFSFLTPVGTILLAALAAMFLSKGSLLLRSTVSVMALFTIQTIDYLLIIGTGLFYDTPKGAFLEIVSPGYLRIVFLFVNKLINIGLFIFLRPHLRKLSFLHKKHLVLLFVFSGFSYAIMQYLFSIVIYGDYVALQEASIVAFSFLLCFLIAVVIALLSITEAENKRITNELLQSSNQMLEQNYQQMHKNSQDNAKRLHDFHHHLIAIRDMAEKGQTDRIQEYVGSLLETSYRELKLCRSGCDIVDAVINYQHMQALEKGVDFKYRVRFGDLDDFAPVDICAILSNQIENAMEACVKIAEKDRRFISIEIRQQENFVLFQVSNSVDEDPFLHNAQLATTKPENPSHHGLGLKSIRDTAKKYSGSLQIHCENGVFTSAVLLCRQFKT